MARDIAVVLGASMTRCTWFPWTENCTTVTPNRSAVKAIARPTTENARRLRKLYTCAATRNVTCTGRSRPNWGLWRCDTPAFSPAGFLPAFLRRPPRGCNRSSSCRAERRRIDLAYMLGLRARPSRRVARFSRAASEPATPSAYVRLPARAHAHASARGGPRAHVRRRHRFRPRVRLRPPPRVRLHPRVRLRGLHPRRLRLCPRTPRRPCTPTPTRPPPRAPSPSLSPRTPTPDAHAHARRPRARPTRTRTPAPARTTTRTTTRTPTPTRARTTTRTARTRLRGTPTRPLPRAHPPPRTHAPAVRLRAHAAPPTPPPAHGAPRGQTRRIPRPPRVALACGP